MNTVGAQGTHFQGDLLILGAGPAGCAAAISALQSGMNVALLEAQASPRLLPGETLHPGVEPIFKQLGIWDSLLEHRFHRHRGIWHESDNGDRVFEPYGSDEYGSWLGFQVDRFQLNEILRTRVANLGGKVVRVAHIDDLLYEGAAVTGVCANDCRFAARFVLDATGRHCWLANRLDLIPEKLQATQRVRFGWTNETLPELAGQPLFRQRTEGWDWFAPLGDGRCAWAKLRLTSAGDGMDFTWRVFRECAGQGYFFLGDAACLMDPSAANGVLRALISGIYAVHLITAVCQGTLGSQHAAREYKRWVGEMFDRTITDFNYLQTNQAHASEIQPFSGLPA
jgi:2-polyprenyl-6-methoxyphenol hydroxylase-like FAD-dependent oxidoreductase